MMLNKDCSIYIFSPLSDVAYVIVKFIKKYQVDSEVVGVEMPTESESVRKRIKHFDKIVGSQSLDLTKNDKVLIPTGAFSTRFCLERCDIKLGNITLNKSALKVFNKPWLLNYAKKIGIPIPSTWESVDDIANYPIFYKQRYEKGGGTRGIAKNKKDLPQEDVCNLIFQECIASKGTYGVSFLAKDGILLCSHIHFESESFPKEGGSAVIIETFKDDRLFEYTKKLIKSLHYSGWGLAEFKYCYKRNDYVFMEINAKFWASCELAFINEPKFLKLLFDIDSSERSVKKIFFVDRGIQRGTLFFIKNLSLLSGKAKFRVYPNWKRKILIEVTPNWLKLTIKKIVANYT